MTKDDILEFAKILAGLGEVYDKKVTDALAEVYFDALADYSIDDVERAAAIIVKSSTFFPRPCQFIELIDPHSEEIEVRATQVLEKVFDAMQQYGAYATVQFDDPVIHSVIEHLGGWVAFVNSRRNCVTEIDDRFWRRDFTKLYEQFSHFTDTDEIPAPLPGIFQIANVDYTNVGLAEAPEPVLITTRTSKRLPAPTRRLIETKTSSGQPDVA